MRSDFGHFAPIARFGYGVAVRTGFQDACKLPAFDGLQLRDAIRVTLDSYSVFIPEMVVLDDQLAAMDCDALVEMNCVRLTKKKKLVTERSDWPAILPVFERMASDDGKLR